jgi:hypothetical protein
MLKIFVTTKGNGLAVIAAKNTESALEVLRRHEGEDSSYLSWTNKTPEDLEEVGTVSYKHKEPKIVGYYAT